MKTEIREIKYLKKRNVGNIFKTLFPKQAHSLSILFTLMFFSFVILFFRIAITKTLYYTFLVWNIFLAIIPYVITMYLSDKKKLNKISFIVAFSAWLAFLPNAPYIITDLYHLSRKISEALITTSIFLSAFGVYIGRFLRFNSWQILSHPQQLFSDIINMILHPIANKEVWLFTILFGFFLQLGYSVFKRLKE